LTLKFGLLGSEFPEWGNDVGGNTEVEVEVEVQV
jgi:hypothetical protein